ncbi:MAG: hypothetical protein MUO21_07405, partial [Nitrososphaeraceae archaeon]|nr:hypothetical protein [Nitrososphaeraceae archaeon]
IVTVLNGLAYGIATPIFTKIVKTKTIPIVSAVSALTIFSMAFLTNAYQFIVFRCVLSVVQSGLPPNLLGGKSGMKGTAMGILNSARFIGQAIGPYISTDILGDGQAPKPFYMFTAISGITLTSSFIIYLIQRRNPSL